MTPPMTLSTVDSRRLGGTCSPAAMRGSRAVVICAQRLERRRARALLVHRGEPDLGVAAATDGTSPAQGDMLTRPGPVPRLGAVALAVDRACGWGHSAVVLIRGKVPVRRTRHGLDHEGGDRR